MAQGLFDRLLESLAGRLEVEPDRLVTTRMLEVEGVAFRFDWQSLDGESVFIGVCHFGPLPQSGDRQAQLVRLLEVNLYLLDSEIVTFFASDRNTGDILLCLRASLASFGVDALESVVIGAAAQAREWRAGRYSQ
jgi:hypothetical protein